MTRYIFLFVVFHICLLAKSQSLSGLNGLGLIPSAEMHPNGTFILGGSYFDYHNFEYGQYRYNGVAGYASLTFLPFLELSFRYTSQLRTISDENNNFPDRMPSVRLQLLKESEIFPAITVGVHDISSGKDGRNKHFEATYFVLTKNLDLSNVLIKVNGGYGLGVLPARHHEMEGLFAGLSLAHQNLSYFQLILEYDSRDINAGIKVLLWERLQLLALAREMKYLEGGISYRMLMK